MSRLETCIKKDKRLLVLLVFGFIIVLGDTIGQRNLRAENPCYHWLEIRGSRPILFRCSMRPGATRKTQELSGQTNRITVLDADQQLAVQLKEGRGVRLSALPDEFIAYRPPSPRLAFFLGRPFSINTASADDLMLIPRIGPVLAGSIIAYRDQAGLISGPDQLTAIHGIGPRLKLLLQDYLTFTSPVR